MTLTNSLFVDVIQISIHTFSENGVSSDFRPDAPVISSYLNPSFLCRQDFVCFLIQQTASLNSKIPPATARVMSL